MKKRMFQILDEMNVADGDNGTAHLGVCNQVVSVEKTKGGCLVAMGAPEDVLYKVAIDNKSIAILLIIDKAEYDKIANNQPCN